MKRIITVCLAALCLCNTAMAKEKKVKLRFIETTDVHGCFFPYDFIERKPTRGRERRRTPFLKQRIGRVAHHEDGRLADVRLRQLLGGPLEADLRQVEAEDGVRLVEQRHDFGILGEVLAHARHLGPLAREDANVCHVDTPCLLAGYDTTGRPSAQARKCASAAATPSSSFESVT